MEEEGALREAESWAESARELLTKGASGERYTVVVAQCIHAMIRANDSLSMRYLKTRAKRHEEAIHLFRELVKQRKIPPEEAGFAKTLTEAIQSKAAYDYGGRRASKAEAERWLWNTEKFILMTKRYVP